MTEESCAARLPWSYEHGVYMCHVQDEHLDKTHRCVFDTGSAIMAVVDTEPAHADDCSQCSTCITSGGTSVAYGSQRVHGALLHDQAVSLCTSQTPLRVPVLYGYHVDGHTRLNVLGACAVGTTYLLRFRAASADLWLGSAATERYAQLPADAGDALELPRVPVAAMPHVVAVQVPGFSHGLVMFDTGTSRCYTCGCDDIVRDVQESHAGPLATCLRACNVQHGALKSIPDMHGLLLGAQLMRKAFKWLLVSQDAVCLRLR